MKTNKVFNFAALMMLFASPLLAATPQVVDTYLGVFVDLLQGKGGIIVIALLLGFSGYMAWRNGNLTPLIWGLIASVLIGGGPFIAPEIISFGNQTFVTP